MRTGSKAKAIKVNGTTFYRCAHPQLFNAKAADEFVGELHEGRKLSNGTWEIPNFRIFAETKRFNSASGKIDNFDRDWLKAAATTHDTRRNRDKYLPPVHAKHTDNKGNKEVKYAGRFKDVRYEDADVEGESKGTLVATLTEIPDAVFKQMERGEFGYRSVEINKPDTPEISSLALLDYEVPYFKFPVARVKRSQQFSESNEPEPLADRVLFAEADGKDAIAAVFPWPVRFGCMAKKYEAADDDDGKKDSEGKDDDSKSNDDDEKQKMMAGEMPGDTPGDPAMMPQTEDNGMAGIEAKLDMILQALTAQGPPAGPPPPVAPMAASEDTDTSAKFAELETLKQSFAEKEKADFIARKTWELSQHRFEQEQAGGGKVQYGYNPQALQQFSEAAAKFSMTEQESWWENAQSVVKMDILSTEDQQSKPEDTKTAGQQFAESVAEDKRFTDKDPEKMAQFAEAYDRLPEGRKANYEDQAQYVYSQFLDAEYYTEEV